MVLVSIDFLKRVVMLRRMQGDDGLAQSRGVTGVESRIPLFILFAEPHDDDVGLLDQCLGADSVQLRALAVVPELIRLGAENGDTAVIGIFMHRDRRV